MIRRRVLISSAAGITISLLLFALEAHHHNDAVMLLQSPGFLTAAEIWGIHSGGQGFLPVMLLVNTLVYSLLVFAAWMMIRPVRKAF